jgi:enhancing lycopene biosynthesis protein 2
MTPKVGVLLSGCGFLDGSEIHEAVLTMLFLDRAGAELVCMAPKGPQMHVVDHAQKKPAEGQSRDMLVEAARIARGRIRDLATVKAAELDAIVLPGGFGAAKNLCNFAVAGARSVPHPQVARLLREMHGQHKPIGAVCIAPAVVANVLGKDCAPMLTIGDDRDTAAALAAMGARHTDCAVQGFCADEQNKIVSTPAYMFDARISEVAAGIERLVQQLMSWCSKGRTAAGARA